MQPTTIDGIPHPPGVASSEAVPAAGAVSRYPEDALLIPSIDPADLIEVVPGQRYERVYEGLWTRVKVTVLRGGHAAHPPASWAGTAGVDRVVWVIRGRLTATDAAGTRLNLRDGSTFFVPAGSSVSLAVEGSGEVVLVTVSNSRTFRAPAEDEAQHADYLRARIYQVPTDRISRMDPDDVFEDIPGKLWRRVWRMTYLDAWLFDLPWHDGLPPFASHAHIAEEVVFNYRSDSELTDHKGRCYRIGEGDALIFPSQVPHGGRISSTGRHILFLSIFCPHRPVSPSLAWTTSNQMLEQARKAPTGGMTPAPLIVDRPANTPVAAYDFWHKRWAEYLGRDHTQDIIAAGLVGVTVTERAPDVPDGTGYFTYRFLGDGRGVEFLQQQGDAICEYDSYDVGFEVFSDPGCDPAEYFARGEMRIVKGGELWARIVPFVGVLRAALVRAIADLEQEFNLRMPKYPRVPRPAATDGGG